MDLVHFFHEVFRFTLRISPRFGIMALRVISMSSMPPRFYRVWSTITKVAIPSQRALARAAGVSRSTVRQALAWLEQHGYIRREIRQRFRPHVEILITPPPNDDSGSSGLQ